MTSVRILTIAIVLGVAASAGAFDLSGTVTDPLGGAVPSVEIRLFDGLGNPIGIPLTVTDAVGSYVIVGLPNGSYVVQFRPTASTVLLAEERPATIASSNLVLDASLTAGILLSGHVRDSGGTGIPSIDLQARNRDTGTLILTPGDDTDALGFYDVVIPPGEYDLEWRSVAPGGLPWIPVSLREVIEADTVIDVTMYVGEFVSGTVTTSTGVPVANVNLDFIDLATGLKLDTPGDNTDIFGAYTVQVPVGDFEVIAKPAVVERLVAGHMPSFSVVADTTGIDFVLQPGFLLSGLVTGPTAAPVAGVDIDVTDAVTGADVVTPHDVTDLLGVYQIVVPPGVFDVAFTPQAGSGLAPGLTTSFAVPFDSVLNTVLVNGVVLSGTVTGTGGIPVPGVDIDMKYAVSGFDVPLTGDSTDLTGFYSVTVAPGTYTLEIEPAKTTGLVAERTTGLSVPTATIHDAALAAGVDLTGVVSDQLGQPVSGVNVDVRMPGGGAELFTPGSHTAADGSYHLVIPFGLYDLIYKPGASYAVQDSVVIAGEGFPFSRIIDVTLQGVVGTAADRDAPALLVSGVRAHPNPFNPTTSISFELAEPSPVTVGVHDAVGRRVAVLVHGDLGAGTHVVPWSGRDDAGRSLPSGVYFYVVDAAGAAAAGKITLVK